jgi:UDP-N-acetylmuramoylalanine--D-glutamate ligase
MNQSFRNRRATIMGLGHFGGGLAAARWLARQGAVVTVSDAADEAALADALAELKHEPITALHLGGHREDDFRAADLIVVNPAVHPDNPYLQIARDFGVQLTSEMGLFLAACPARVVGVTGSNGKSTTAAMTAAILQADGRRGWLGGNIGGSLLDRLPEIGREDWVVVELSSFQLWHRSHEPSPPAPLPERERGEIHVAIVTNCTANHLDWHGSMEHYIASKQRILTGQTQDDLAVLNMADPEVASWRPLVCGRFLAPWDLQAIPPLAVPGEHNRINAACAAAAAEGIGCGDDAIRRGLQSFHGLSQRLEYFAVVDGRRFYNDSTATTPQSTIAALQCVQEPLWLLAGGRDKGFDFHQLADAIVRRGRGAAFFGATGRQLRELVAQRSAAFPCADCQTLDEAIAWCWHRSQPGDAIVLSPACASTDQFRNFRQRGETFAELARQLAEGIHHLTNNPTSV